MKTMTLSNIVNAPGYTLAVDPSQNRVLCVIEADIDHIPDCAEIDDAWLEIGSYLSETFTVLLDAGIEKVQRPELVRFLLYFQETAAAGGLGRIAEVLSGSTFAYMLHARIADMAGTGDRRKIFDNYEQAEEWLDAVMKR